MKINEKSMKTREEPMGMDLFEPLDARNGSIWPLWIQGATPAPPLESFRSSRDPGNRTSASFRFSYRGTRWSIISVGPVQQGTRWSIIAVGPLQQRLLPGIKEGLHWKQRFSYRGTRWFINCVGNPSTLAAWAWEPALPPRRPMKINKNQ